MRLLCSHAKCSKHFHNIKEFMTLKCSILIKIPQSSLKYGLFSMKSALDSIRPHFLVKNDYKFCQMRI